MAFFTKDSSFVQNYIILITLGLRKFEDVPALFNLREMVAQELGLVSEEQ